EWRSPYGETTLAEFRELVERGRAVGVEVGFAVSPGLSIEYASVDDVQALQAKFRDFQRCGARFFSLALDDVPTELLHYGDRTRFGSLAAAHVHVAHAVAEALDPQATLWVVPTDYVGTDATDYLEHLGSELAASIEVGWTGRTVLSPTISAAEAERRAATLRRRLLVWDNVPVSDGPMRPMLHLGPFVGRDPELGRHVSGVLLNPMVQLRASAVAIHTAAAYLRDPEHYEPEAAWRAALAEIGAGAPEAFAVFAEAHRFSPLLPADRDRELEAAVAELGDVLTAGGNPANVLAALQRLLAGRIAASDTLRDQLGDRRLVAEIEPWL